MDAIQFKLDWGREDCTEEPFCIADYDCDGDVDGLDTLYLKLDWAREDCPDCSYSCY